MAGEACVHQVVMSAECCFQQRAPGTSAMPCSIIACICLLQHIQIATVTACAIRWYFWAGCCSKAAGSAAAATSAVGTSPLSPEKGCSLAVACSHDHLAVSNVPITLTCEAGGGTKRAVTCGCKRPARNSTQWCGRPALLIGEAAQLAQALRCSGGVWADLLQFAV